MINLAQRKHLTCCLGVSTARRATLQKCSAIAKSAAPHSILAWLQFFYLCVLWMQGCMEFGAELGLWLLIFKIKFVIFDAGHMKFWS